MTSWSKNIVEWFEGDTAYLSVVFTWQLSQAYSRMVWYKSQDYKVKVGGTAVRLMPNYLNGNSCPDDYEGALNRHNPDATRTSLGCPNACSFCGVRLIEPKFRELLYWEPKPIICDNNLTACSLKHFDRVVDSLKPIEGVDFNQGLDCRLLKQHHIDRLRELKLHCIRFAWDNMNTESKLMDAIGKLLKAGFPKSKIRVYVLFNYKDTLEDALYRCETLKKMGILPNPQRYQPLDTLIKNSHVDPNWNETVLLDFTRYWSRQNYLRPIPFSEYHKCKKVKKYLSQSVMKL